MISSLTKFVLITFQAAIVASLLIMGLYEQEEEHPRQLFINDVTDELKWRKVLHQVAAGLVMLSWAQWYSVLFRVGLISGEVCFIVWAWVYPNVELDTVIWNSVLIVINLIHLLLFFLSFKKPKLTIKEEEIYQHDFHLYFTPEDFKEIMKHAHIEVIKQSQTIIKQNEIIKHLYYCHIISKGSKCKLSHNGRNVYSVCNTDWLEIFDSYHALTSGEQFPWSMTAKVLIGKKTPHFEVVKFDLEALKKYFSKKGQTTRVRNSFYAYLFHKRMQYLDQKVCTPDEIYKNTKVTKLDYLKLFHYKNIKLMTESSKELEVNQGNIMDDENKEIDNFIKTPGDKAGSLSDRLQRKTTMFQKDRSLCSDSDCSFCGNINDPKHPGTITSDRPKRNEEDIVSSSEESKVHIDRIKTKFQIM
ncbi:unnamed protein product [Moneuplotes crassus]|uniref:POPDC1-3 domain-containing protein n=2 Tax=Euplotes crassus TaxID=5936 RepID=A0AAD1ULB0_EUPCR|nr:unnamed protein product [Moneuplotes crassus]